MHPWQLEASTDPTSDRHLLTATATHPSSSDNKSRSDDEDCEVAIEKRAARDEDGAVDRAGESNKG